MIDWRATVKRYHSLGLWHATNYLKTVITVRDPWETAHDVVQDAWLTLWQKEKFTKGLFVTVVLGLASNAARASRPIEMRRGAGDQHKASHAKRGAQAKVTGTFPVQVFGQMLDEITYDEETKAPSCGDE